MVCIHCTVGAWPGLQGDTRLLQGSEVCVETEKKPVANQVEGREECSRRRIQQI